MKNYGNDFNLDSYKKCTRFLHYILIILEKYSHHSGKKNNGSNFFDSIIMLRYWQDKSGKKVMVR